MEMKDLILPLIVILLLSTCRTKDEPKQEVQQFTSNRVFDEIGELSEVEKNKLTSLMMELEKTTGSQIAILIVDTLNGEKIEEFSGRAFDKMNLGRSKIDDGLLIVQSLKDKKIRIEVGLGLERIIKDEIASKINREMIIPRFKEGKYYDGFYNGVTRIIELIEENKDLIGQPL
jgi:uncharacterized protein